jgi:hypothetical protein
VAFEGIFMEAVQVPAAAVFDVLALEVGVVSLVFGSWLQDLFQDIV